MDGRPARRRLSPRTAKTRRFADLSRAAAHPLAAAPAARSERPSAGPNALRQWSRPCRFRTLRQRVGLPVTRSQLAVNICRTATRLTFERRRVQCGIDGGVRSKVVERAAYLDSWPVHLAGAGAGQQRDREGVEVEVRACVERLWRCAAGLVQPGVDSRLAARCPPSPRRAYPLRARCRRICRAGRRSRRPRPSRCQRAGWSRLAENRRPVQSS